MTAILVDTSAYSAFRRGHNEIVGLLQEADRICLTPIVLGELHVGFRKGKEPKKNVEALRSFLDSPRVDVPVVDAETSERYSEVYHAVRAAGRAMPTNDLWIAASAMQHGLIVVTTDEHFSNVPQILTRLFSVA